MAIEYQTRKTPGGQSRRCGARLTAKKGEFSMAVSTIQCTAMLTVALVIRATDSLFWHFCAKLEGRNNPINVATPDVLTHAEAAKSVTYEGG